MIIDLRPKYINNALETNMSLFCDENYNLVQFFFKGMKYNIPSYSEKENSIHVYYFQNEIILPRSLTVYRIK